MEKLKKIFSPGHEKDEDVMYNDPNTSSSSTTRESATPTQHGLESSTGKNTDLRHNVLDPQSNVNSRPNPAAHVSSASTIPDDASTASIRSGVVGAGQGPPSTVAGTGFNDYASGLAPQQKMPIRSVTPVGQSRPKAAPMETMDPRGFVTSSHAHKGAGHNYQGDPCPEGDEPFVPGYPHHQQGPHSTDIANRLDPHVPGEFPSDDGLDAHERRREGGLTSGSALGSDDYSTQQRSGVLPGQGSSTTDSTSSHHGRDAALGAGAGAAGLGAYESLKHHDQTSEPNTFNQTSQPSAYNNQSSAVVSPSTTDRSFPLSSHPTDARAANTSTAQPITRDATSDTSRDHHLGRDAALVGGGLGAAGLGAHESGSHRPSREIEGYDDQRFDPSAASGDKPTRIPNLMYGHSDNTTRSGPSDSTNHGRDAALAGGAGVGTTAVVGSGLHGYNHGGRTETDPASKTIGPHKSNVMNILDPRVQPEPEKMKDRETSGPYNSDAMNTLDPRVNSKQTEQSHLGRDAAVGAGAAGVAGAGAYEYGQHRAGATQQDPASYTTGPHSSNLGNVVDPRVQPQPEKMHDRTTTGPHQSNMMNRADPRVDSDLSQQNKEHHYGRDAALAGGAGAAGIGAYEYAQHRNGPSDGLTANVVDPNHDPILEQQRLERERNFNAGLTGGSSGAGVGALGHGKQHTPSDNLGSSPFDPRSTNTSSIVNPSTDPSLAQQTQGHHYGRDAAVAGGVGAAGAGAYEHGKHHDNSAGQNIGSSTFDPRSTNTSNVVDPSTDPTLAQQKQGHHYGRDAAAVGGVGAAGAGAYDYGKHHGGATDSNLGTSTFDPRSTNTTNVVDPNNDPLLAQQRQERQGHHLGRDAAIAGGAGAAGYGAYEALDPKEQEKLAKHQAKEAEKAQKAQQHQLDKDQKTQQHQMDKDLKHQQKEREHEIAKQEKAAAKDREHEQKKVAAAAAAAHEKEEKKHKHDLEKAEKQREKEADRSEKEAEKATKENEHPEKKHHSLLGFLHRDKKNEPEADLVNQGRLQEADIVAHERHQRELEAAAARGQVSNAGAKFEPPLEEQRENPLASAPQYSSIDEKGHQTVSTDTSGRHRLHKDPPASVLKERGLDSDQQSYGSGSGRY
ncbi:hypothetical protein D6D29_07417 [Aureobasidium pullulans]|nr:hypothetical protein D6D29_07417 [Aureobasidium pullulans]